MVIFHSYVSLPEGRIDDGYRDNYPQAEAFRSMIFNDDLKRIYGEMAWYPWIFMVLMNIPHLGGWYPLVN